MCSMASTDAAREQLHGSIADAESCQMTTLAALARRRFAELADDAARSPRPTSRYDMRGIADPARFAQLFATWPEPENT